MPECPNGNDQECPTGMTCVDGWQNNPNYCVWLG
jgi:hypothetical protein